MFEGTKFVLFDMQKKAILIFYSISKYLTSKKEKVPVIIPSGMPDKQKKVIIFFPFQMPENKKPSSLYSLPHCNKKPLPYNFLEGGGEFHPKPKYQNWEGKFLTLGRNSPRESLE